MLPPGSPRIASLLPARYDKIAEMVGRLRRARGAARADPPRARRALAAGRVAVVHVRIDPKAGAARRLELPPVALSRTRHSEPAYPSSTRAATRGSAPDA